jgi:hypothetical protein
VNVESIIEDVLGSWEFVYEQFDKPQGSLTMFATMFGADNEEGPFAMVDAVLFYDINTGEVYKYEEADYAPCSKSWNDEIPYKLDELKIEIAK